MLTMRFHHSLNKKIDVIASPSSGQSKNSSGSESAIASSEDKEDDEQ